MPSPLWGEYQFLLNERASLAGLYAVAGARRADEGQFYLSKHRYQHRDRDQ